MWSIRDIKERGRIAFKANYWRSVLSAFLLILLAGGTAASSSSQVSDSSGQTLQNDFNALPEEEKLIIAGVVLGSVALIIVISIILKLFVFNPLEVGCYRFFRKNVENTSTDLGAIKEGFSAYGHIFVTLLLRDIFLFLWTILFIIPGIVKSYSYRMVPYIIKDNPELTARDVITRSRQMMNGNKWRAFLMDLSFIGWFILGILTLGLLNIFWTDPYYYSAGAALYLELKDQ